MFIQSPTLIIHSFVQPRFGIYEETAVMCNGDVKCLQPSFSCGFPRSHGSKHIFPSPQRIKVRPGSCNLATVAASSMEKTRS